MTNAKAYLVTTVISEYVKYQGKYNSIVLLTIAAVPQANIYIFVLALHPTTK